MQTYPFMLLALKVAILGGWGHLVFLLARSLRHSGRNSTVHTFRLRAMLLGVGAALQGAIMVLRQASFDGILPGAIARWSGWIWVEAPVTLLVVTTTLLLVRLMTGQRYRVIDDALREVRQLRAEVGTDPLTGLLNRSVLSQQLEEALASGEPLCLIFIDVDDFKQYNDAYGHLAGDTVLKGLGSIFQQAVRRSDLVARYGGEEFVILLPGANRDAGIRIAEHLRSSVAEAAFEHRHVTISVGVAASPADAPEPGELLELADQAMYRAKADGGNRVYESRRGESHL